MIHKVGRMERLVLFPKSWEAFKIPLSITFPIVLYSYNYSSIQTFAKRLLKKSQMEVDFVLFQIDSDCF